VDSIRDSYLGKLYKKIKKGEGKTINKGEGEGAPSRGVALSKALLEGKLQSCIHVFRLYGNTPQCLILKQARRGNGENL